MKVMPKIASMFAFAAADDTPKLPAGTATRVAGVTIGALVLGIGAAAAMLSLLEKPDWWRGLTGAGVVVAIATVFSLVPLLWGIRRSVNAAVAGYFIAMGIRAAISVGGCLLLVYAGGYPRASTLLLMAAIYFVVLAAEAMVVAAASWSAGSK